MKLLLVVLLSGESLVAQTRHPSSCSRPLGDASTFAAVYFDDDSLKELSRFDMVVLDPENYDSSDIAVLKSLGCRPLAYFNVGEVETYRDYFDLVDTSMLLSADPRWRDRYYVDICDPQWEEIILKTRLPDIIQKGFCGLFVDFAGLLDEYPDEEPCAVSLIRKLRSAIHGEDMVLDGGDSILAKVGNDINGIAVEGLRGSFDFDSDSYITEPDSSVNHRFEVLSAFAKRFKLSVFQLDFAAPDDQRSRDRIIIESRIHGFVPYVGTVELDTLFTDTIRRIKLPDSRKPKSPPDTLK